MAKSVTLHIVQASAGAPYDVQFYEGPPVAVTPAGAVTHSVAAADIGAGAVLDTVKIDQILANHSHSISELKQIGEKIAAVLLAGAAGKAWHKASEDERRAGGVLRTHLSVPEALQALPWEFCRIDDDNVFFNSALPLVRALRNPLEAEVPEPDWPLRVLAVAGDGNRSLHTMSEVRRLRQELKERDYLFDLEIFNCQTRSSGEKPLVEQLAAELDSFKPHILHFAGHATYDAKPFLQLGAAGGPSNLWSAENIGTYLGLPRDWKLRFVFLNACNTQRTAKATNSFLRAFVEKGRAFAAVALCADADGAEAAVFAAHVYRFLGKGKPIDEAVAMARAHIGPDASRAVYYPVVSARVAPDALAIPARKEPSQGRKNALSELEKRKIRGYVPGRFVDRGASCRNILERLCNGDNVVLVQGSGEDGKSWFLQSCRRLLAWRGWPMLYCDLERYKTWPELLVSLLSGGDRSGLGPVIDAARVATLKQELKQPADLITAARHVLEAIRETATLEVPAVLLIDQLATGEVPGLSPDSSTLKAALLDPIADGDGRIRIVIASAPDVLKNDPSGALLPTPLELQPFPAHAIADLAHELFAARGPTEEQWKKAEKSLSVQNTVDLPPKLVAEWVNWAWRSAGGKPDV